MVSLPLVFCLCSLCVSLWGPSVRWFSPTRHVVHMPFHRTEEIWILEGQIGESQSIKQPVWVAFSCLVFPQSCVSAETLCEARLKQSIKLQKEQSHHLNIKRNIQPCVEDELLNYVTPEHPKNEWTASQLRMKIISPTKFRLWHTHTANRALCSIWYRSRDDEGVY